jgi:hypothetical protein
MACDCKTTDSLLIEVGSGGNTVVLNVVVKSVCETVKTDAGNVCQLTYTVENTKKSNAIVTGFNVGRSKSTFTPPIAPGGVDTIVKSKGNGHCEKKKDGTVRYKRDAHAPEQEENDLEVCVLT